MEFQREKNESGCNEDADLPWGDYQGEILTYYIVEELVKGQILTLAPSKSLWLMLRVRSNRGNVSEASSSDFSISTSA